MSKKLTYEFVKERFEKEGYELLSKEYVNAYTKLRYRCLEGHIYSISWANWQQGRRCQYCSIKVKKTIEFIRSEFEREDYILLAKEYINNKQKLEYICPKGHKHSINWNNWTRGKRCPYCARTIKLTIEFIGLEFEDEGYELLSREYVDAHTKLKYRCPKGHEHLITWGSWSQGRRCPYCTGRISKGEVEVRNFVESLGIGVLPNSRNQIFNPETGNGFELDIWMPGINKAVEYNGEYWHNRPEAINRDALKQHLCKQGNIGLLVVWDNEWLSDNNVCKNKIKKFVAGL